MRAYRVSMRLGSLPAVLLALACVAPGAAQAQSASSYQQSCNRIGVAGDTLFANCRRMDGGFTRTSIAIPGVSNIDGVLQFDDMQAPSTFQNSCTHIGVAGSTLFADCRRRDGSFNRTSIAIPGIANINGQLRYQ